VRATSAEELVTALGRSYATPGRCSLKRYCPNASASHSPIGQNEKYFRFSSQFASDEARPAPFPPRDESLVISHSTVTVSPGTTWRRKRARSTPPKSGRRPE